MVKAGCYAGIDKDVDGGLTSIGKIVRDAWVFEVLPETETCEGWDLGRMDVLLHQVNDEWDKYGCMVSNLPDELRERHNRIYAEAIERAKKSGWGGEKETDDEG